MRLIISVLLLGLLFISACQNEAPRTILNPPEPLPQPEVSAPQASAETNKSSSVIESPEDAKAEFQRILSLKPDYVARYDYKFDSPDGEQTGYETIAVRGDDFKDYVVTTVNRTTYWQSTFFLGGSLIQCFKGIDEPDRCFEYPKPEEEPAIPGADDLLANVSITIFEKPTGLKIDAECFAIDAHLSSRLQIYCYTNDGVLAYIHVLGDGIEQWMTATDIAVGEYNDEFELPAEVVTVPESWLR
jgi:hypothetical protein